MNGSNAEPACPHPAIQPIDPVDADLKKLRYINAENTPVNSQGGNILPAWFMVVGYIGPNIIPMKAIAMAPPTSDGTNHTTNSKPMARKEYINSAHRSPI